MAVLPGSARSAGAKSTQACCASNNIASNPPHSGQFIQSRVGAVKTFLSNKMRYPYMAVGEYSTAAMVWMLSNID